MLKKRNLENKISTHTYILNYINVNVKDGQSKCFARFNYFISRFSKIVRTEPKSMNHLAYIVFINSASSMRFSRRDLLLLYTKPLHNEVS